MMPIKVEEKIFDLSENRDLSEMERIRQNPEKYRIIVDETLLLPFRHMSYEVRNPTQEAK